MTLIFTRNFDDELNQEINGGVKSCDCAHPSQEEIDALIEAAKVEAFQSGYDTGFAKGSEEVREEVDQTQAAALGEIKKELGSLFSKSDRHNAALEAQILDFTLSICEQVFPYLQHSQSHERALQQIKDMMRLALSSPYINISLSKTALPKLTPIIDGVSAELGLTSQVKIRVDGKLEDGATHIEWQNGFMDYSFDMVCERILTALKAAQTTSSNSLIDGNEKND